MTRIAFLPARAAARASRDQLASTPDDVLVRELASLIDRAFSTTLPEEIVHSAVRHQVVERLVAELAASGALDRAVREALDSPRTSELTDAIARSEPMRRAIREVVEGPEMRAALARQTTGLAEELVGGVRARAVRLDDRIDRRPRAGATPFAGAATRAAAMGIDAAVILLAFVSLSALVALVAGLVGTLRPEWLVGVLLASGWMLLAGAYFVVFWSGAGQTPGGRLLRLRLLARNGRPPSFGRALIRVVGTVIAIVPFFAGYVPVLFDRERRGLPDLLAGTVVVYEDGALADDTDR